MKENKRKPRYIWVFGKNLIFEILNTNRKIIKILVSSKALKEQLLNFKLQLPIIETTNHKLDILSKFATHQGIMALVEEYSYSSLEDILDYANSKNTPPFLVLLDGINDPHNLGSILRVAEATGVDGIVIPKKKSVGLTPTVAKVSSGAIEYVPVARSNIYTAINFLKHKGFWIVGMDLDGKSNFEDVDTTLPLAVVFGSEGKGIRRIVKEHCDFNLKLKMKGKIGSFNVAVAAGIVLYNFMLKRQGI